jgi:hypothetical protein
MTGRLFGLTFTLAAPFWALMILLGPLGYLAIRRRAVTPAERLG